MMKFILLLLLLLLYFVECDINNNNDNDNDNDVSHILVIKMFGDANNNDNIDHHMQQQQQHPQEVNNDNRQQSPIPVVELHASIIASNTTANNTNNKVNTNELDQDINEFFDEPELDEMNDNDYNIPNNREEPLRPSIVLDKTKAQENKKPVQPQSNKAPQMPTVNSTNTLSNSTSNSTDFNLNMNTNTNNSIVVVGPGQCQIPASIYYGTRRGLTALCFYVIADEQHYDGLKTILQISTPDIGPCPQQAFNTSYSTHLVTSFYAYLTPIKNTVPYCVRETKIKGYELSGITVNSESCSNDAWDKKFVFYAFSDAVQDAIPFCIRETDREVGPNHIKSTFIDEDEMTCDTKYLHQTSVFYAYPTMSHKEKC